MDHPKIGDPERGVESGLASKIVSKARVGNFDHEFGGGGAKPLPAALLRIETKSGSK